VSHFRTKVTKLLSFQTAFDRSLIYDQDPRSMTSAASTI